MSTRRGALVAALALAATTAGCSIDEVKSQVIGDSGCEPGPVVYLVVDTSKSTRPERVAGGSYELAAMKVVRQVARDCGALFAAPADGNAIANARWQINGPSFRKAIGGNKDLNATVRARQASEDLADEVHELLHTKNVEGSDVLGALDRVSLTARATFGDRRKLVVILTDGALFVHGRYDVYKRGVATPAQRSAFLTMLRSQDEIPDLRDISGVYIGGLALNVKGRNTARGIIRLWQDLVPEMDTRLLKADSTLRFP